MSTARQSRVWVAVKSWDVHSDSQRDQAATEHEEEADTHVLPELTFVMLLKHCLKSLSDGVCLFLALSGQCVQFFDLLGQLCDRNFFGVHLAGEFI